MLFWGGIEMPLNCATRGCCAPGLPFEGLLFGVLPAQPASAPATLIAAAVMIIERFMNIERFTVPPLPRVAGCRVASPRVASHDLVFSAPARRSRKGNWLGRLQDAVAQRHHPVHALRDVRVVGGDERREPGLPADLHHPHHPPLPRARSQMS